MAEQIDSSSESPETDKTSPVKRDRVRRLLARRSASQTPVAPERRSTAVVSASAPTRARTRTAHPVRSLLTVTAVAGLVATVAIPAFAASRGTDAAAMTLQQVAAENAQNLVVASEATPEALERGGYSATTPEEIDKKKAAEAAKKALAARLAAASVASSSSSSSSSAMSMDVPATIAAAGAVVRPLPHFDNFGTPYAGHKGTDYMVARGTPIYAIADGVVVASSESGPGWGVYVKIAHNIGGRTVTSLYAHMGYGTRRVTVGQTVSAGQLIGQVSDTGRAFGTHLHLEIYVGGSWVNAEGFLAANAG